MIASGVVFFGGVVGICIYASDIIGGYKLDFGKDGKKLDKNLPNYRDIPCNKDIFKAYFISTSYNLLAFISSTKFKFTSFANGRKRRKIGG